MASLSSRINAYIRRIEKAEASRIRHRERAEAKRKRTAAWSHSVNYWDSMAEYSTQTIQRMKAELCDLLLEERKGAPPTPPEK